jgi:hypothetical protein
LTPRGFVRLELALQRMQSDATDLGLSNTDFGCCSTGRYGTLACHRTKERSADMSGMAVLRTGVARLDDVLGGGLVRGRGVFAW